MARGLSNCHPVTREALETLGVVDSQVTQAYGNAAASAGFHLAEGEYQGKKYSSCVDLSWQLATVDFFHRMAEAGFAVFYRDWHGNRHIHAVHIGLTDDSGTCRIKSGPRQQIIDWCAGLDGLVNHKVLTGPFKPTKAERESLRKQYAAWVPDYATTVRSPEGKAIRCYAFLESGTVQCDINAFLAWWGYSWDGGADKILGNGKSISVPNGHPVMAGGHWLRGPIRPFAEAIGLTPSFEWAADKTSCIVKLTSG